MRDINTIRKAIGSVEAEAASIHRESPGCAEALNQIDRLDAFADALRWVLCEKVEHFPVLFDGLLGNGSQPARSDLPVSDN